MKYALLISALASHCLPAAADICLPNESQPETTPPSLLPPALLDPNSALDKSPEMQPHRERADQISEELAAMASVLSTVQDRASADAAAEAVEPVMAKLRWLMMKDHNSSEESMATALLLVLKQDGQNGLSKLMEQIMRLSLQDFYGSDALRAALHGLN